MATPSPKQNEPEPVSNRNPESRASARKVPIDDPSDPGPLPPSRPSTPLSELKTQLRKAEQDLNEEKILHQQTRLNLQRTQQEADESRKQWLQSAKELNRLMRRNQGFNQSTDDELSRKGMTLRYEIRGFAIQHFGHEVTDLIIPQPSYDFLNRSIGVPKSMFEAYMHSTTLRPALLQAFVWGFLADKVFTQFRWAPRYAAKAMVGICDFFGPLEVHDSDTVPDAQRKFYTWRANTSSLILSTMSLDREKLYGSRLKFSIELARQITEFLRPFSQSRGRDIEGRLADILIQSLELDEEISRQVASVTWSFDTEDLPCRFDPKTMELEPGQKQTSDDLVVRLILAPAMLKRGKSSGDNFDVVNTLLKMEVECEPPRTRDKAPDTSRLTAGTTRGWSGSLFTGKKPSR